MSEEFEKKTELTEDKVPRKYTLKEKQVLGIIDSIKNWSTKKFNDFTKKFKGLGFWILIVLMLGVCIGIQGTKIYVYSRASEAILLGGFVYHDKIYTITEGVDKVVK